MGKAPATTRIMRPGSRREARRSPRHSSTAITMASTDRERPDEHPTRRERGRRTPAGRVLRIDAGIAVAAPPTTASHRQGSQVADDSRPRNGSEPGLSQSLRRGASRQSSPRRSRLLTMQTSAVGRRRTVRSSDSAGWNSRISCRMPLRVVSPARRRYVRRPEQSFMPRHASKPPSPKPNSPPRRAQCVAERQAAVISDSQSLLDM